MHETIIAKQIIEEAKKQGKVKSITVEIGDIAHLPAEEMEACLKKMVDWEVRVIKVPAVVQCVCGFKGNPDIVEHTHDFTMYLCPQCSNVPATVLEGSNIVLKEVVLNEDILND